MLCPICNQPIPVRSWSDDVAGAPLETERLETCPEGHFLHHYAYGQSSEVIGEFEFTWSHHEAEFVRDWRETEMVAATQLAREAWVREHPVLEAVG